MQKISISFISFLMILSLVSIGFCSWNIVVVNYDNTISGSIQTDSVINGSDYISNKEFILFDYSKSGFVNDGILSYNGSIKTKFEINLKNCEQQFGKESNLHVIVNLKRDNINKFNKTGFIDMGYTITYNNQNITSVTNTITNNEYIIDFEIDFIENMDITNLEIIYNFQINKTNNGLTYFKETIYPELMSNNSFGISAKISGK